MAGGDCDASARLRSGLGATRRSARDGIVYFDPFRFEVEGVCADLGRGDHRRLDRRDHHLRSRIGARARRGRAEVPRPRDVRGRPGGPHRAVRRHRAGTGRATWTGRPSSASTWRTTAPAWPGRHAITGSGTLARGRRRRRPAPARPTAQRRSRSWSTAEFELLVTTTVPTPATLTAGGAPVPHARAVIGIAPMGVPNVGPTSDARLTDPAHPAAGNRLGSSPRWSAKARLSDRRVGPAATGRRPQGARRGDHLGDRRRAVRRRRPAGWHAAHAGEVRPGRTGPRKPLPFVPEGGQRSAFLTSAKALAKFVGDVRGRPGDHDRAALAGRRRLQPALRGRLRAGRGRRRRCSARSARASWPQPVDPVHNTVVQAPEPVAADLRVHPPRAIGLLAGMLAAPPAAALRTTVRPLPDVAGPPRRPARRRGALTDWPVPVRLVRAARGGGRVGPDGDRHRRSTADPGGPRQRGAGVRTVGAADSRGRLDGLTAVLAPAEPGQPRRARRCRAGGRGGSRRGALRPESSPSCSCPTRASTPTPLPRRPRFALDGGPGAGGGGRARRPGARRPRRFPRRAGSPGRHRAARGARR